MRVQPMVIGHHYMASAGQYLATEAAHAILRAHVDVPEGAER